MGNFVRRVPGNYPALTADELNAMLEVAQAFRRGRLTSLLAGSDLATWKPANIVYVQNGTGSDLAARAILTASGVALDPATDPVAARKEPTVEASTPTRATDPVLVVLDGIADGTVGRAVVAGVTVAQVSVSSTGHRFARPVPGTTSHLVSAASGPVRLLVPPAATGTQMAYVLLGSGGTNGTGTDCNGDGWLVAAKPEDYWTIQEIGGAPAVEIGLKVTINEIAYTVSFDPAAPSLKLNSGLPSAVDIVGRKDCSVCPCVTFAFRRKDFYPDFVEDPDDVCARVLYVKVCQGCPEGWYCVKDAGTDDEPAAVWLDQGEACGDDEIEVTGGPYQTESIAVAQCAKTAAGGDCSLTRSDLEEGVWYNFSGVAGDPGLGLIQQLTDPPYVLEAACDNDPGYGGNMGVVYTNCTENFFPPAYGPGVYGGNKQNGSVSGHRCISLPTGGTVRINFGSPLGIPFSVQFRLRKVAVAGCPDNGTHTITPCGGIPSMKVQDRIAIEFITGSSGAYLADVGKWIYLDYDSGSGTWKNPSASFGGYTGAVEINYSSCITFVQIPGGPSAQGVYSIGGVDYCDATLTRNRLINATGDFGWFHVRGQLEWEG